MRKFEEYLNEAANYDIADVDDGVAEFLKIANDAIKKDSLAGMHREHKMEYVAQKKQKYTAIYISRFGKVESIHAFIDNMTGSILKPAGFKKPAKGSRGNVTDTAYLAKLKAGLFDLYGGYLYKR